MSTRKFFLCTGQCVPAGELSNYPNSHIIGEVHYVLDDGQRVTALAVYETSLPSSLIPASEPSIRVEVIGDARRIQCTVSYCKHFIKRWEIGRLTFLQLSRRYDVYFKGEQT
jgi:hypothetical protein